MIGSRVDERSANRSSWHFLVSETTRHVRGHTLYKVTLQVVPVDISAAVQEIIWWKRYTEFQVIHKTLSQLHAALFLKGTFPAFPKPTVFHKHDEPIIEIRRQAAEKLLNFISGFPILCRHDVFRDFLKGGEQVTHWVGDCDTTAPLQPQRLYAVAASSSGSVDDESLSDDISLDSNLSPRLLSPISGIWRHRCSDDEDPVPEENAPATDWPDTESPPTTLPLSPTSSSDLLSTPTDDTSDVMTPKRAPDYVATLLQAEVGGGAGAEDYLFLAGHHLARANDKELAGDYEGAFGLYKLGIDVLLRGVQTDEDAVRRDAVRRKAGKYLSKAEQLYKEHITAEGVDNVAPLMHSEYSSLASSRAQLAQFTVISVLDVGVLLVMHKTTRENFVIKTLRKSPSVLVRKRDQRTIIPLGAHKHMVQLRQFVETDDAIHLIMERAPGGKLLNYVAQRMSVAEESSKPRLLSSGSASSDLSAAGSDYSASFSRLMETMAENEPPAPDTSDYASLFYKFVPDQAHRARSSSLAFLERSGSHDAPREPSPLERLDMEMEEAVHPDAMYLREMEPLASPTLRGLENWRDVGGIDSDQLIAKSKELLMSVDKTIRSHSEHRSPSPLPPPPPLKDDPCDTPPVSDAILDDTLVDEDTPSFPVLRRVPEVLVRRWVAEVVLGVEALHELGIVCGDLQWDNILLGDKGCIKLTYFSQWSSVIKEGDYEFVPENAHIPPELRRAKSGIVDPIADSWSIGVILFELLTGQRFAELNATNPNAHRSFRIPSDLSPEAQDLLRKLLKYSPRERLSLMEIKEHPFFRSLEWRRIQP